MEVNKIPAAEEFFNQYGGYTREEMLIRAIEFAKMHVKAALEAAVENETARIYCRDSYDEFIEINKESILTAYPENLIK